MRNSGFWSERLRKYGHTGWTHPATYAYDQQLRLRAIAETVENLHLPDAANCVDFGCGVGDFASFLARRGYTVRAYDPVPEVIARARVLNAARTIQYTTRVDDALSPPADLILCVTVLQHIVDDTELASIVERFAKTLVPGGCIVVLETFGQGEVSTAYTRLRSRDVLVPLFEAKGLQLERSHAFHHPTISPTPEFGRYQRRLAVRILSRLQPRVRGSMRILNRIASRHVAEDHGYFVNTRSPTELLVFRKGREPGPENA